MLINMQIDDFTNELASSSPAPGGGTVSAIVGGFAAGLGEMVCNLTIGNEKYPEAQPFLPYVQEQLCGIGERLLILADEDTKAFNNVMAAYRMKKVSEEEKLKRNKAILGANIEATIVPMKTAELAVKTLELLPEVITYGNVNAISDCGVAIQCARAAGIGALMNVQINIGGIKDEVVRKELAEKKDMLENELQKAYQNVAGVFSLRMDVNK